MVQKDLPSSSTLQALCLSTYFGEAEFSSNFPEIAYDPAFQSCWGPTPHAVQAETLVSPMGLQGKGHCKTKIIQLQFTQMGLESFSRAFVFMFDHLIKVFYLLRSVHHFYA